MPSGKKPMYTPEQDVAIEADYLSGMTIYEIADRYGGSSTPVLNALARRGVSRRLGGKPQRWFGTPEQRAEARRLYDSGLSVAEVAKEFGCPEEKVSAALHADGRGVRRSGGGHKRRLFDDAAAEQVGAEYTAGAPLASLAQKYGTNTVTVRNTLRRQGIALRSAARPKFWTDERLAWIAQQYLAGRSQQAIATELGVPQTAVSKRLLAAGVRTRAAVSGDRHGSWKGGRSVNKQGYVSIRTATGYEPEHRLVMAQALGRPLDPSETVHHINGDKQDNRLANLQLRQGRHGKGVVMVCADCGSHNITPRSLG